MPLRLRISAGSNHDDIRQITPNLENNPVRIRSDCFNGELRVRIRNFRGLPAPGASAVETPYFDQNDACTYSIDLRGRFLIDGITFDDLVFGNVFETRVRLPPGAGLAVSIVRRWIDPGLEVDLYADKPWARSPVMVTMNAVRTLPVSADHREEEEDPSQPLKESHDLKRTDGSVISTAKERKKYFSQRDARVEQWYRTDCEYGFDFCNGMADFNEFSVRIPGWGFVSVLPFWDGQALKYVMETRDRQHVIFVLLFELVEVSDDDNNNDLDNVD